MSVNHPAKDGRGCPGLIETGHHRIGEQGAGQPGSGRLTGQSLDGKPLVGGVAGQQPPRQVGQGDDRLGLEVAGGRRRDPTLDDDV